MRELQEQRWGRSVTVAVRVAVAPPPPLLLLLLLLLPLICWTQSCASCILLHMCCSWRLSPSGCTFNTSYKGVYGMKYVLLARGLGLYEVQCVAVE